MRRRPGSRHTHGIAPGPRVPTKGQHIYTAQQAGALLGVDGSTVIRWAEAGLLGVRSIVTSTLAADHRVSDGLRGAKLLAGIAQALAKPEAL